MNGRPDIRRLAIPVLLTWAVVATVLALRSGAPPVPPREPGADPAECTALREEVSALRAEVADLRAKRAGSPGPEPDRGPDAAPKSSASFGKAADRLLAEYRALRDAGRDAARRKEILDRLSIRAEANRSILLVLPVLLREAVDEEEADRIADAFNELSYPDPGGPIDLRLRAGLRAVLADEAETFRRAIAADLLMWCVRPTGEDFGVVLEAARRAPDQETRMRFLEAICEGDLRQVARPEQAAEFTDMIREAMPRGEWSWAATLARWSDERSDFDMILGELRRNPSPTLLWALSGKIPLTRGREDECRTALAAVVSDRRAPHALRVTAVTVLGTLRPWGVAATDAVKRFRDESK